MYMSFESPEGKLSQSYFFVIFPNVFLELQAYISRTNKHDYGFVSHCIFACVPVLRMLLGLYPLQGYYARTKFFQPYLLGKRVIGTHGAVSLKFLIAGD